MHSHGGWLPFCPLLYSFHLCHHPHPQQHLFLHSRCIPPVIMGDWHSSSAGTRAQVDQVPHLSGDCAACAYLWLSAARMEDSSAIQRAAMLGSLWDMLIDCLKRKTLDAWCQIMIVYKNLLDSWTFPPASLVLIGLQNACHLIILCYFLSLFSDRCGRVLGRQRWMSADLRQHDGQLRVPLPRGISPERQPAHLYPKTQRWGT